MNFLFDRIDDLINIFKRDDDKPWYDFYGNNIPHTLDYPEGSIYDAFHDTAKKYPLYRKRIK